MLSAYAFRMGRKQIWMHGKKVQAPSSIGHKEIYFSLTSLLFSTLHSSYAVHSRSRALDMCPIADAAATVYAHLTSTFLWPRRCRDDKLRLLFFHVAPKKKSPPFFLLRCLNWSFCFVIFLPLVHLKMLAFGAAKWVDLCSSRALPCLSPEQKMNGPGKQTEQNKNKK